MSSSTTPDPFAKDDLRRLPPELHGRITPFLPTSDLLSLTLTCKTLLHSATDRLFEHIYFNKEQAISQLLTHPGGASQMERVRSLDIIVPYNFIPATAPDLHHRWEASIDLLVQNTTKLQSLCIVYKEELFKDEGVFRPMCVPTKLSDTLKVLTLHSGWHCLWNILEALPVFKLKLLE